MLGPGRSPIGGFDAAAYFGPVEWRTSGKFGVSMAALTQPADTLLMLDCTTTPAGLDIWNESFTDYWPLQNGVETWTNPACSATRTSNCSLVARRHSEGANIIFADGHAKWQKKTLRRQWTRRED